jgi:heavy metal translocating P-type ATPase
MRMSIERVGRWSLFAIAVAGLAGGALFSLLGRPEVAAWVWIFATMPVIVGLAISIVRDLLAGRMGVDAIALISMSAAIGLGQPLAGAVVALMYSGGNMLEEFAVARAEGSLHALVDRAPRTAHRRTGDNVEVVPVDDIVVGDLLLVRAGEVIPVDGIVKSDSATIDEAALTGEPLPVAKARGNRVSSGTINAGATFDLVATALADDSTYAGIVRLVAAAQTARAPFVRLADRFALAFLPITLFTAFVAWLVSGEIIRSLAVFVAATPCPLILAAPVAFVAGIAQAARRGVLIKGGGPLEALARTQTVLFDKTGTLTVGGARLLSIETAPEADANEVLRLGGSLEQASQHILAAAIVRAAIDRGLTLSVPNDVRETLGVGLSGVIGGRTVSAGARDLVFAGRPLPEWARRAARRAEWRSALLVFIAVEDQPIGALLLADELRTDAPRAVRILRDAGVTRIMMLTGDRATAAQSIGAALDLDVVLSDCNPTDKVEAVRAERRLHPTAMVGDGINDAPALASADVGLAMGARGATASSEAADVVILADRLDRVGDAIVIAQRARRIALESIIVGMGLSTIAMIAAAAGWLAPVPAAVVQEFIDVAVILNALRALNPGRTHRHSTLSATVEGGLHADHLELLRHLERLRTLADRLDDAAQENARALIVEANTIVQERIVKHERDDEADVYAKLSKVLADRHGLAAMSRAHREIQHLARLLARIVEDLSPATNDRYLIRDAQRLIESIETLVAMHTKQEDDIYEAVGPR